MSLNISISLALCHQQEITLVWRKFAQNQVMYCVLYDRCWQHYVSMWTDLFAYSTHPIFLSWPPNQALTGLPCDVAGFWWPMVWIALSPNIQTIPALSSVRVKFCIVLGQIVDRKFRIIWGNHPLTRGFLWQYMYNTLRINGVISTNCNLVHSASQAFFHW